MNFTGRTWRPPYEASSFIIQATTGCTHNKCRFCNLYKDECFSMTPLDEWRKDWQNLPLTNRMREEFIGRELTHLL